jgi:L-2-hydroxycarboxylate dehydrogenase (NAD+)
MNVKVEYRELERFMKEGFIALGVPEQDAAICALILIESDLRGIDSHGIGRFQMYVDRIKQNIQRSVTDVKIIKRTANTAVIDGNHGMGHLISYNAMNMAIEMARTNNVGIIAVKNSTHFGITGYYTSMAVNAGMVGLAFSNARPSVAPTFGIEPVIGTNPISFGAPTDDKFPFLMDFATSTTQRGKIELYARDGKPTPKGLTIDINGKEPTDSAQLLKDFVSGTASLLPLGGAGEEQGGYKGYGLGLMVEILCASFANGSFGKALNGFKDGKVIPYGLGHFFVAVNIESFVQLEVFKRTTGNILREVRSSKKQPGHDRIFIAGEKEFEMIEERKTNGIPIDEHLQKIIKNLITELKLSGYNFPFLK